MKKCILASGVLASLALHSNAFGQTAAQDQSSDIVVTAQRRSETAQRAAVAITAVSGDALTALGINDSRGLQKILSSVEIKPEGPVSQTFIRGVGNNIDLPYTDPAVAYNLNGVFLPRYATASAFFDLERVEVLPGPQGTLYGGAAAGGVVNLVTRTPKNDFSGDASIEVGNLGLVHGSIAQNLALGSTLSARIAVDYLRNDGYQSRGFAADDRLSGRVSLLWEPNATTKLLVWAQGYSDAGEPVVASLYAVDPVIRDNVLLADPTNPLIDPSDPWYVPRFGLANNPVNTEISRKHYRNYAFGARLDIELGDLALSYIPGLVLLRNNSLFYAANFPLFVDDHENQITQELKLSGEFGSRFSWISGLYYSHTRIRFNEIFFNSPVLLVPRQTNESYAAYAQGTYKVADALRLTVGGRVSSDGKKAVGSSVGIGFTADHRRQRVDYKVLVEADLARDVMVYGAVQSGYLPVGYSPAPNISAVPAGPGGVPAAVLGFSNEVVPERLRSYTAGLKSRFFNGAVTFNNEAYYYDYRDYQVVAINVGTGLSTVFSAQKARIYGDQMDIAVHPTDADTLTAGLGFLHTKFTNFVLPDGRDFTGNRLTNSAKFTATLSATHRFDLASGGNVTAQVNSYFNSGYFGQYDNTPEVRQKSFNKTDMSLTYNSPDKKWTVRAWVLNVNDVAVRGAHASVFPGVSAAFLDPPRTYGFSVGRKW